VLVIMIVMIMTMIVVRVLMFMMSMVMLIMLVVVIGEMRERFRRVRMQRGLVAGFGEGMRGRGFCARLALVGLSRMGRLGVGAINNGALDAFATAAPAQIAMARAAAAGAVLALLFGLAMGALLGLDQRLTVGDRDLVVVRMDFAEGEEAVTVAAIFDESGLQRGLYPRHLGEVDIAAQLLALGGFEVKLFDAIAADHDNTGLFRMRGIDQHLVGHF